MLSGNEAARYRRSRSVARHGTQADRSAPSSSVQSGPQVRLHHDELTRHGCPIGLGPEFHAPEAATSKQPLRRSDETPKKACRRTRLLNVFSAPIVHAKQGVALRRTIGS